ncbi:MAG: menaquinone biosynthesis protein [Bryobacteraceae bacterium]
MAPDSNPKPLPKVCAVSYLNTVPLVWGFLHDPALRGIIDLEFALPSVCADRLRSGAADIGIIPVIEMARQNLDYIRGVGITSDGPVRSILLFSKVPFNEIRTLATDTGSRTSVMLSRVILAEKYGAKPKVFSHPPDLQTMLATHDAALLIGDAALDVEPSQIPYACLDLGDEWTRMTGLPMVFALWSGKPERIAEPLGEAFRASCRYGMAHLDDIVPLEAKRLGYTEQLVRDYFTRYVSFDMTDRHYAGLQQYLKLATALDRADGVRYAGDPTAAASKL